MAGYQEFIDSEYYSSGLAGAIIGIRFIRRSDGKVFEGFCTGATPALATEQIPHEAVGNANPSEIIQGRNNVTVSFNGYFSADIGDNFLLNSLEWGQSSFDVQRYISTGLGVDGGHPYEETIIDVYLEWSMASSNQPQGGRGALTFDVNGPAKLRLTGKQFAEQGGLM